MLDIKFIRENPDAVKENIKKTKVNTSLKNRMPKVVLADMAEPARRRPDKPRGQQTPTNYKCSTSLASWSLIGEVSSPQVVRWSLPTRVSTPEERLPLSTPVQMACHVNRS